MEVSANADRTVELRRFLLGLDGSSCTVAGSMTNEGDLGGRGKEVAQPATLIVWLQQLMSSWLLNKETF